MAVMEADVEKAIVAAKGADAKRVPFDGQQRIVRFYDGKDWSPILALLNEQSASWCRLRTVW